MKHETNFQTASELRQPVGLFVGALVSLGIWILILTAAWFLA